MDDTKFASLKEYLREIFETSLITGIAEITKSRNWTKKIIKTLVFLLCLIGFIYQTLDFLNMYFSYPTVSNVVISNPTEILMPAITIGNRNSIRRSVHCSEYPGDCAFMNEEKFCKIYPRNCPTNKKPFTKLPYHNSVYMFDDWSWDEQKEMSHTQGMIKACHKFAGGNRSRCTMPYLQNPFLMYNKPNMGYSIETLWGKPNVEPAVYPNTLSIKLTINTEPEEYAIYKDSIFMHIVVHDARKLVNPFTEGYSLRGGVEYMATVSMTEKKYLPAPYDTNCTDYLKLWKENNGTGPLNDFMCFEYCHLNTLLESGECIDTNVNYPNMEKPCNFGVKSITSEIIEKCKKECGNPCSDSTYEVRYEEVNSFENECKDEWCRVSKIQISLLFNKFRITTIQYEPKFESIELYSYIGGYMGMWLGLSLVALFDFIETMVYLFYYPIGRLIRKMQRKRSVSHKVFKRRPPFRSEIY